MVKKVILPVILAVIVLLVGCLNEQGDIIPSPSVYVIGTSDNITSGTATDLTGLLYGDGSTIDATAKPTGTVVGTSDEQTLTNKTFTTPVLAQLYQDAGKTNLLTFPSATDTLVGKATTDELTNKTLNASVAKGTWTNSGTWTLPAFTMGNTVTINGQSFNAGAGSAQINTTGAPTGLKIVSTQDSVSGVRIHAYHVSATPAAGDSVLDIIAQGKDSAGNDTWYGQIQFLIEDSTSTTEASYWKFRTTLAGAFNDAMTLSSAGNLWVDGDCSALTFTDRTKWFEGDALKELSTIKGEFGLIDHDSLPLFAKKLVPYTDSNNITQYRDERDLGAMITLLTKAVQQLTAKNAQLEYEIEKLKSK